MGQWCNLHTQLKMGWAYTLGIGVYIRKGCKSWTLSVSKTKGVSHNPLARGVIQIDTPHRM